MVIPDEWQEVRLGDLGRLRGGVGFPLRFQGRKEAAIPFYKVSDMNLAGNETFMRDANNWVSEAESRALGAAPLPAGSIVFAKVGAAVFLERKRILTRPSCVDNNMMALIPEPGTCDTRFLHFALQRVRFGDLVSATALPSINASGVSGVVIALPPLREQEAIAEALGDADAATEAFDALIAKKRDVKQAAMQQLLTGRTRLSGFEEHWRTVGFDQALRRTRGPGRALLAGEYTDAGSLPIIDQSQAPIAGWTDRTDLRVECPAGGVIVFGDHTRVVKYVGTDFVVGADGTQVLSPVGDGDARFLAYLLQRAEIPNTGYNRHFKFLKDLRLECPEGTEQRAIARVLSDIDAEIDALVAQREKMRLVKQGMMQELLSGRVRLV